MINLDEKWHYQIDEPILQIEIGDINNNGQNEIIAVSKSGRLLILSLTGKALADKNITEKSSIWKVEVRDIDNDNKNEIILGGLDGILRVFKCNSSYELEPFWEHQFGASISDFFVSDINNDNVNEIIAYSIDNSIRVLNSLDGSLIWGQLFEDGIGNAIVWQDPSEPALKEVIAAGNDGTVRIFKGMDGDLLWFKRYTDKIRCVSLFKSNGKEFIVYVIYIYSLGLILLLPFLISDYAGTVFFVLSDVLLGFKIKQFKKITFPLYYASLVCIIYFLD